VEWRRSAIIWDDDVKDYLLQERDIEWPQVDEVFRNGPEVHMVGEMYYAMGIDHTGEYLLVKYTLYQGAVFPCDARVLNSDERQQYLMRAGLIRM
jgi:uncharacterized DUF497 family protein